jgi:hypothetical protein
MTKEKLQQSRTVYHNRFVAVEGTVNDWACYVGRKDETDEYVRSHGDKISESQARELFPDFEKLHWRP